MNPNNVLIKVSQIQYVEVTPSSLVADGEDTPTGDKLLETLKGWYPSVSLLQIASKDEVAAYDKAQAGNVAEVQAVREKEFKEGVGNEVSASQAGR